MLSGFLNPERSNLREKAIGMSVRHAPNTLAIFTRRLLCMGYSRPRRYAFLQALNSIASIAS